MPRTSWNSIFGEGLPGSSQAAAVRRAASMTPPVVPKMVPAPVPMPSGLSNSSSGREGRSMPAWRNMRASSRVVRT